MKFEMVMDAPLLEDPPLVEAPDELIGVVGVDVPLLVLGPPPQAARSRAPATSRTPAPLLNRMRM
jgi:hypothetical protein